jgi:ribonuclease HI
MSKRKFYVVWEGHQRGIFTSWDACKRQIDNYPGAKYKSYGTEKEAINAFEQGYQQALAANKKKSSPKGNVGRPILQSISVDAACSGNPGKMEYQGVDTRTGDRIFHQGPFEQGTNNIGEFLALVHGIALLKKHNNNLPIYSDSKIALGWIKKKKCKTQLARNKKNEDLFKMIARAEEWLEKNSFTNPLLKWETKVWGEIPADFGRK